ncbi:MAG TPA: LysR family transcriptional regulator [Solirubrobacteraceae bacterium]|nr:LysR family transcriptional regulator [Solirubrobacteraceae bacterium]
MDLRQLEYVVAVADSLSFTRAAEQCHVVQSALSHQIQRLEAELDVRLFERTSRRVRTTAAGELLVAYARQILGTVAEARVELDALAGLERGSLAVGATQTAGRVLDVIAVFGTFHRQHSAITLTAMSGPASELVEGVRAGWLDLAFVAGSADAPHGRLAADGLDCQVLVQREPLVAVVGMSHRLSARARVRLAQLSESGSFVEFRAGTGLRTTVDDAFATRGLSRSISLELGQIPDMVRFASHGLATAIVPRVFARDSPAGAAPYAVLRLAEDVAMSVTAIRRSGSPGLALGAFLEVLGR